MLLGFYGELKHKAGHAIHSSHPKLLDITYLPLSTRLLTPHQIEDALHVVNSTSNNGAGRNYLHGRFGKFVNLIKVAYLGRKANALFSRTRTVSVEDDGTMHCSCHNFEHVEWVTMYSSSMCRNLML
jgi:hypothetical protein